MPVTFGSVGDIVSVCLLVKDLIKALDDCRGSAGEYRELTRDLWALDRVLLEVESLCRRCPNSPQLNTLRQTAEQIAKQCRGSIDGFLTKIKRYDRSLGAGGDKNVLKDTYWKLQWKILHKDDLAQFRAMINTQVSFLNLLLVTSGMNLAMLHDDAVNEKLATSEHSHEAYVEESRKFYTQLTQRSTENLELLKALPNKVAEMLGFRWLQKVGGELKEFMQRIWNQNVKTHEAIARLESRMPVMIDPKWSDDPVWLEDALGRRTPIHVSGFIDSWEAFHLALLGRWKGLPGRSNILKKHYVLHDTRTQKMLDMNGAWTASFIPGRRLIMSLLFDEDDITTHTTCPRCRTENYGKSADNVQCENCGLRFQRIDELKPWTPDTDENLIPVPYVDTVSAKPPETLKRDEGNRRKRLYSDDADADSFRNLAFISRRLQAYRRLMSHHDPLEPLSEAPPRPQRSEVRPVEHSEPSDDDQVEPVDAFGVQDTQRQQASPNEQGLVISDQMNRPEVLDTASISSPVYSDQAHEDSGSIPATYSTEPETSASDARYQPSPRKTASPQPLQPEHGQFASFYRLAHARNMEALARARRRHEATPRTDVYGQAGNESQNLENPYPASPRQNDAVSSSESATIYHPARAGAEAQPQQTHETGNFASFHRHSRSKQTARFPESRTRHVGPESQRQSAPSAGQFASFQRQLPATQSASYERQLRMHQQYEAGQFATFQRQLQAQQQYMAAQSASYQRQPRMHQEYEAGQFASFERRLPAVQSAQSSMQLQIGKEYRAERFASFQRYAEYRQAFTVSQQLHGSAQSPMATPYTGLPSKTIPSQTDARAGHTRVAEFDHYRPEKRARLSSDQASEVKPTFAETGAPALGPPHVTLPPPEIRDETTMPAFVPSSHNLDSFKVSDDEKSMGREPFGNKGRTDRSSDEPLELDDLLHMAFPTEKFK